jgi:pre-mRNA-processing factor 40
MDGVRSSVISSQADPEYSTFEEAESAFHKLLRRVGVQPEWTWEHAVRAAVKDPQYRAIKDPKDRKIAFEKYQFEVRAQEKDREKERQAKLRADFNNMLRSHPEITHYTRWTTARSIIERETIFRSARSEEERQSLFNEYRAELLKAHNEDDSRNRRAALDKLVHLLQSLDLEPYTRWSEAQSALKADERFQGDEQFQSLSKIDVLKAFESHIKALERSFNDTRQKQKTFKARQERQNRDQFISLLKDLRSAGKIKAGAKWSDIHELIEDDPRYVSMLGQAGSTPLDLFWDMVEEEERMLRGKRNDVLDVLQVCTPLKIMVPSSLTRIRKNDMSSHRRLPSTNSYLSCKLIVVQHLSTPSIFASSLIASMTGSFAVLTTRSMLSGEQWIACDLKSSVWNPRLQQVTLGSRFVHVSRSLKSIELWTRMTCANRPSTRSSND